MKNWSKGDRVSQPTYGAGTLVEVNEHHTVIDFDEGGRKVFATRLVVLQASNEPAPHKTPTRKRAVKKKKAPTHRTEHGGLLVSAAHFRPAKGRRAALKGCATVHVRNALLIRIRSACSGSTRVARSAGR